MLKVRTYIKASIFAIALPVLASCFKDDLKPVGGGETVSVVFTPDFDSSLYTKAISDGTGADELMVTVYENSSPVEISRIVWPLDEALVDGVELRLLSGHNYQLLFWAYDSDNTAYTVSESGIITADYTDYLDGGFAKMEQLDAFYALSSISVSSGNANKSVTLKRPFAQLNIADDSTEPIAGTHVSEISFEGLPLSFDVFTGKGVGSGVDKVFTFADFTGEVLTSGGDSYYYVATNYIFVPESGVISATCRIKQDGAVVTEQVLSSVTIAANKRTNVLGTIVGLPEDIWDGSTLTVPVVDDQNRYVIDETSDLAWLAVNGLTLESNRTFIVSKDLNMGSHSLSSVKLPQGSTVDGGGHTIKNVVTSDGGLFGNATDLILKNLTIDGITVGGATGHVGALVNTLQGSGSMSSVTVKNAVVSTTNGAAGGMVGYVVRKSVKDRSETLTLTFDDCHADNVSVSGSQSEGLFVGLLSGYDGNETINFSSNCTTTASNVADYASPYREGNEGAWLADTDYSKYNAWLGDETFSRGVVNYGEVRFVPRWDGVKKVEPLVESGAKVIYSAFDLAYLQGGSHASVTFKSNVDLGGVKSTSSNPFSPIYSISSLDGGNYTIYNLLVNVTNWIGAFIGQSSSTTVHKNLKFSNSSVSVKPTEGTETAYAATLCAYVEGNYTAENIHIQDAYVLGISKSGGLNGFVTSAASFYTVKNSSINKLRLENSYLHLTGETFTASGEMGGLVGFIQQSALIEGVSVTNSVINCTNSFLRYVNQFVGTTRLDSSSQRIDINRCNVSGNTYENDKDEKSKFVGGFSLSLAQRGKVYIDGSRLI